MKQSISNYLRNPIQEGYRLYKIISLLRKDIHKRIGKLLYHQKYTADEIVETMCNLGMKKGSVICIHASMKEFYNYQGTAEELIKKIKIPSQQRVL